MAMHSTKEVISPMPEPWQSRNDLAFWLDWVRAHAGSGDPESENAELRDALTAATLDLLNVVKFYRSDREYPANLTRELVPRFTVMTLKEEGTVKSQGVYKTEREAEDAAAHVIAEPNMVKRAWVRRSLVPVVLERLNQAVERVLAETGLTEDELADAISKHPA
ncbi:MAG: hypothetical protein ACR2M3_09020 [Thermomicrobiales bacterium]